MLLVGGDSVVMMLVVSIYQGLLLSVANLTYMRMRECRIPRELALLYAIFFCIFFFALSIPLWLNVFVILTSLMAYTKAFRIFFSYRGQAVSKT
jgi:phosphatidylserine synthase